MAEGPRRGRGKRAAELPPPAFDPKIEELIATAPKSPKVETSTASQPEKPQERIVGRDDVWVREQLKRLDSLAVEKTEPAALIEQSIHTPTAEEVQKELDDTATDSKKRTLENFKKILTEAELEGGGAISLRWVEKIGIAAAKRLSGTDFNDFKRYVVPRYELNEVKDIHPELDFLRAEPGRSVDIPDNLPTGPLKHVEDVVKNLHPEDTIQPVIPPQEETPSELVTEIVTPPDVEHSSVTRPVSTETGDVKEESSPKLFFSESQRKVFADLVGEKYLDEDSADGTHREKRSLLGRLIKKAEGKLYAEKERSDVSEKYEQEQIVSSESVSTQPIPTLSEAPEVIATTVAEEESTDRLPSAVEVAMKKAERISAEESAESKAELKEDEKTTEHGERLKAGLAERSAHLSQEVSEKYGTKVFEFIEGYNKLGWKKKLAITGCLMVGAGLSATAMPAVATVFSAALWGQRIIGGLGATINRRKGIDAEVAKNPESWLANRSEFTKNTYAFALGMMWSLGTSLAVHGGVEAVKVVAQSGVVTEGVEKAKELSMEAFGKVKELSSDTLKAYDAMNWDWLSKMLSHQPGQVEVENLTSNVVPDTMPGVPPSTEVAPPVVTVPASAAEVPLDQVHTVQTLDPTLFAEPKNTDQLRVLAENSFAKLTPNEHAVLNNHISSMGYTERQAYDGFVAEHLAKMEESPNVAIRAELHGLNEQWSTLHDQREQLLGEADAAKVEGSDAAARELSGAAENVQKQMDSIKRGYDTVGPETPFGRDPIDGHILSKQEAADLAHLRESMHPKWPPSGATKQEEGLLDKMFSWFKGESNEAASTASAVDAERPPMSGMTETLFKGPEEHAAVSGKVEEVVSPQIPTSVPGVEPSVGHASTGVQPEVVAPAPPEVVSTIPADQSIETAAIPQTAEAVPKAPESGIGPAEGSSGGDRNIAEQYTIDDISATEPHIYLHSDGHLFAYGGSIEGKIDLIQKFLTENPDKVIYGTDDNGNYRIPWSLYEGHALPGEPVRTSGFLGFGSSFVDAPKPEDFTQQIPFEHAAPITPAEMPKAGIDTAPVGGETILPPTAEDVAPKSEIQASTPIEATIGTHEKVAPFDKPVTPERLDATHAPVVSVPHLEVNSSGLSVDVEHANMYVDSTGFHIAFGGSAEDRAREAIELVSNEHSKVAYYGSTKSSFFGLFQEHHLHKVFWSEGAQQPVIVDDTTDPSLRGNLPSIDDLKQLYKPSK